MSEVEKQVLKEIKDYFKPGGVVFSCCLDSPQLKQIMFWWRKLQKDKKRKTGYVYKEEDRQFISSYLSQVRRRY